MIARSAIGMETASFSLKMTNWKIQKGASAKKRYSGQPGCYFLLWKNRRLPKLENGKY